MKSLFSVRVSGDPVVDVFGSQLVRLVLQGKGEPAL